MNLISPETRMMGLPYGEVIMIVGRTMWTRQTDKQTDRIMITNTVQRIASNGNYTEKIKQKNNKKTFTHIAL